MKLGEYTIKRRYPLIQILVDIASAAAMAYLGLIIYSTAMDIEQLNAINYTEVSLDFIKWQPLLIWAAAGIAVWAVSLIALFKPRKAPAKLKIDQKNGKKYCNIIDCCICCVRLMLLLMLCEGCYLHMRVILRQEVSFSVQLILDAAIILLLILFTRTRLQSLYESQKDDEPQRTITED